MTRILGLAAILMLAAASTAGAATVAVANAKPTPAQAAAVRRAVTPDMRDASFTVATADINGDGKPDLIALYQGGMWCGSGGCSAVAVLANATGYAGKAIGLPNFNERDLVLDAMQGGMHDLRVDQATYVFTWSGSAYR